MARTGLFLHPDTQLHHAPGPHPERPERQQAALAGIQSAGLLEKLSRFEPAEASLESLSRVHDPLYLAALERSVRGGSFYLDPDTFATAHSWRAARLAAGGAIEAVDRVLSGELDNAFCCLRPPGHHALAAAAMGFCLLNQVAIAARHAQAQHGLKRIFILDWDVHHGNGTQAIFERDPDVYYASLHESPLYPGSGRRDERGLGAGLGTLLNCPQPGGAGHAAWKKALVEEVLPELERFRPELVLISAGFDAHALDPLASTQLSSGSFGEFTELVLAAARRSPAGGRLVSVLEGGYHLEALAESAAAHVGALVNA
jgi:acetoin utilization deacetylase AcuC-like enzyme